MNNNKKFWQVVKEKFAKILVLTIVFTYIATKLIDTVLNWALNRETAAYGIRYNYTISLFTPIIFVIVFIVVTNMVKGKLNNTSGKKSEIFTRYNRGFGWKDILYSKDSFFLAVILTIGLYCLIQRIAQRFATISGNYGIATIGNVGGIGLWIVVIFLSVVIVVFLQNTVLSWLMNSEQGNRILGGVVLVFGILTAAVMSGVSYLWTSLDEAGGNMAEDFWLGAILPFDLQTTFFAMLTIWFALKAFKYAQSQRKLTIIGLGIAIVSFVLSMTPVSTVLQVVFIELHCVITGESMPSM